jgi:hypothetical protein
VNCPPSDKKPSFGRQSTIASVYVLVKNRFEDNAPLTEQALAIFLH